MDILAKEIYISYWLSWAYKDVVIGVLSLYKLWKRSNGAWNYHIGETFINEKQSTIYNNTKQT